MSEKQEKAEEVVKNEPAAEIEAKKTTLLGSISYEKEEDYEKFLDNLDISQSIFVLIAAANAAQARGAVNLDEAELLKKAIRVIKKGQTPTESTDESTPEVDKEKA